MKPSEDMKPSLAERAKGLLGKFVEKAEAGQKAAKDKVEAAAKAAKDAAQATADAAKELKEVAEEKHKTGSTTAKGWFAAKKDKIREELAKLVGKDKEEYSPGNFTREALKKAGGRMTEIKQAAIG